MTARGRRDLCVDSGVRSPGAIGSAKELAPDHCYLLIERQYAILELLRQEFGHPRLKSVSASPCRQTRNAAHQLAECDRGQKEVCRSLPAHPADDAGMRLWAHQLADHVGVEQKQFWRLQIDWAARRAVALDVQVLTDQGRLPKKRHQLLTRACGSKATCPAKLRARAFRFVTAGTQSRRKIPNQLDILLRHRDLDALGPTQRLPAPVPYSARGRGVF